jgi:chemotaxis methyl-accepting protein methylase
MHAAHVASHVYAGARHALRIGWNVATLSETARLYPDVALRGIWNAIPDTMRSSGMVRSFGQFIHRRACARQVRFPVDSTFHTFFLRNAPHFEVLRRRVLERPPGSVLRIAAIGCSSGAELYTAIWAVRCARQDLQLSATGVDIDAPALAKARTGVFSLDEHEFSRLPDEELERLCTPAPVALFDREGETLRISDRIATAPSWVMYDARDAKLRHAIGEQDVVFANNILCHMYDREAEQCLRNIAGLVAPGGYLFMYGVDLDVKSRVAGSLGLVPVRDMIEDVYLADWNALARWPFSYWGREPFDATRPDWEMRYAAVYQRTA